jgi:hypothetical protein
VLQHRVEKRLIPVRCLDHDPGRRVAARQRLEFTQAGAAAAGVDGQVADEFEALAVQAAGRERKEQRTRAGKCGDANVGGVCTLNERRAWVGDGGQAGFAQQTDVIAGPSRRQQGIQVGWVGEASPALVRPRQLNDRQLLQWPFERDRGFDTFQELARALCVLDHPVLEARRQPDHADGKHLVEVRACGRGSGVEGVGHEVQRAG